MPTVLLAVDGSDASHRCVQKFIATAGWYREKPVVHLVTVHLPLPKVHGMANVIDKAAVDKYYQDETAAAMKSARESLDRAGIACTVHTAIGPIAEGIMKIAHDYRCDCIYMGTSGQGALKNLVLGSVATKVLHLTDIPVVLVR